MLLFATDNVVDDGCCLLLPFYVVSFDALISCLLLGLDDDRFCAVVNFYLSFTIKLSLCEDLFYTSILLLLNSIISSFMFSLNIFSDVISNLTVSSMIFIVSLPIFGFMYFKNSSNTVFLLISEFNTNLFYKKSSMLKL